MPNLTPIDPTTLGLTDPDTGGLLELGVRDGSSPTETHKPGQRTCTRTVFCDWSARGNAAIYFLGQAAVNEDASPHTLSRLLPQPFPGQTKLVASDVSVKGHQFVGQETLGNVSLGNALVVNKYARAKLDVTYTLELYRADIADDLIGAGFDEYDRYVEEGEQRASVEYQALAVGTMNYLRDPGGSSPTAAPNGQTLISQAGVVRPLEQFPLTWKWLPDAAWGAGTPLFQRVYGDGTNRAYLGCVNKAAFFGRPAWTVMFDSLRAVRVPSLVDDDWCWHLEYTFSYDPNRWTYRPFHAVSAADRPDNGWYFVGSGGTFYSPGSLPDGYSLYDERDLYDLFKVGTLP